MALQKNPKAGIQSCRTCSIIQFSFQIFFAGKLHPKWEGPYIIEEVYHSGAIKINKAEGTNPMVVNGQRIKHYISRTPINVETNIIQTITQEEHIKETFENTPKP